MRRGKGGEWGPRVSRYWEPQGLPSYHPELQSRFHRLFCSQEDLGIFRFVPQAAPPLPKASHSSRWALPIPAWSESHKHPCEAGRAGIMTTLI